MKIVDNDPWLQPVADKIEMRNNRYCLSKENILHHYGSLYDFAGWHRDLGFHYDKELKGWYFRDWLPRALQVYLPVLLLIGNHVVIHLAGEIMGCGRYFCP